MIRVLPKPNLWDTVYLLDKTKLPEKGNFIRRWLCRHDNLKKYVRIDYRAGPGCYANNFEGIVCANCGKVLREKQTL